MLEPPIPCRCISANPPAHRPRTPATTGRTAEDRQSPETALKRKPTSLDLPSTLPRNGLGFPSAQGASLRAGLPVGSKQAGAHLWWDKAAGTGLSCSFLPIRRQGATGVKRQ